MRLHDLTAIGRSIDLHYPTNLAIVLVALLVGAAGAAWHWLGGDSALAGLQWGASAGLTAFLSWALSREMDPDHDLSAFVGVALAIGGLALLGLPALLPLFWQIVALRLVVRSTGLAARPLDSAGLLGLGMWLCWQSSWVFGFLTAATFYLDGRLSSPIRYHNWLAALSLVLTAAIILLAGTAPQAGWPDPFLLALLGAELLLFALLIAGQGRPAAVGDASGEPLQRDRVRAGQVLAAATLLAVAWWAGQAGLAEIWPLAAAVLGVSLYRFLVVPWQARNARLGGRP